MSKMSNVDEVEGIEMTKVDEGNVLKLIPGSALDVEIGIPMLVS